MIDLPAGDDPFRTLGIGPDAGEKELRRAYVERIKVFRPESHPKEFARIRAAFEVLLARLRSGGGEPVSRPSPAEPSPAPPPNSAPSPVSADDRLARGEEPRVTPEEDPVERAWTAVATGGRAAAAEAARLLEGREGAREAIHRFLLLEVAGVAPMPARAPLVDALLAGAPIANWLFDVLNEKELKDLLMDPRIDWEVLSRQPDPGQTALLFYLECQEAVRRSDIEAVARIVESRKFRMAAVDVALLGEAGRLVAAALAWSTPERAERIAAPFETGKGEGDATDQHRRAGIRFSGDWESAHQGVPGVDALDAFLRRGPLLDLEDVIPLARRIGSEFVTNHERQLVFLERLRTRLPDLAGLLFSLVKAVPVRPIDAAETGERAEAAARLFQDSDRFATLPGEDRPRLRAASALARASVPPSVLAQALKSAGRSSAARKAGLWIVRDPLLWIAWWMASLTRAALPSSGGVVPS